MKKNMLIIVLMTGFLGISSIVKAPRGPAYFSPQMSEYFERREQEAVAAEEKLAVIFPAFKVQSRVMEKEFPFLVNSGNWKKVKSFLFEHAGKKYHRNPADRAMLVDLWIGIENAESRDQQIASMNSPQWYSFWEGILNAAFLNV